MNNCPLPQSHYPHITLAHGGGGKLTEDLIENIYKKIFVNEYLQQSHDGALLGHMHKEIVMTTDSYVITPYFFPGGNIGKLSICGSLNDLLMCGAEARYLSCGFILEEGLAINDLISICYAMQKEAAAHGVQIVTGDTKVIEKSHSEANIFINTTAVGEVITDRCLPSNITAGDAIILTNDIARHGLAIMAEREGLQFEHTLSSDCSTLLPMLKPLLLEPQLSIHCLRDLTRGGLATACIELAASSGLAFMINEAAIPLHEQVLAASELLGLDPLYIANEGCCLIFVKAADTNQILSLLKKSDLAEHACCIGEVQDNKKYNGKAFIHTTLATLRRLHKFSGEQLPRIC